MPADVCLWECECFGRRQYRRCMSFGLAVPRSKSLCLAQTLAPGQDSYYLTCWKSAWKGLPGVVARCGPLRCVKVKPRSSLYGVPLHAHSGDLSQRLPGLLVSDLLFVADYDGGRKAMYQA